MSESTTDTPTATPELSDRSYEGMLEVLDVAIDQARHKVESGRVRDVEYETVRIKWIRALAYLIRTRRKVMEDRQLEELTEEVERLKAREGLT